MSFLVHYKIIGVNLLESRFVLLSRMVNVFTGGIYLNICLLLSIAKDATYLAEDFYHAKFY